jgi:cytochrome c-type biogenesis protein CcmH
VYLYSSGNLRGLISAKPKAGGDASSAADTGATKSLKALSDEQLERMVAQAETLTQKEPKNASAWAMLAHSYEMLGKFVEAARAYTTLAQLLPNDAQVLADHADVLAVVNGHSFKGEPAALLKRALAMDPKNAKALVLAGSAAIEEEDYAQAVSHLERARAATTDPALQRQIDASIGQAKAMTGDASAVPVAPVQAKASASAVGVAAPAQVSGRVWLADDLRAKAPAQATVFLYARPVDGSRMPVALSRKKVSDLPLNFTLDDSMGMVPNVSLSKLSTVVVVARISVRGNVTPAAGDLEGVSAPVAVGSKDLKLEITEVLK